MMIDKIGGVNPLNNVQSAKKADEVKKSTFGTDSVSVSAEAKAMAEQYYLKQVAAETPNVRQDRIAELKEKIKDPAYINQAVITSAADHIMESFGL